MKHLKIVLALMLVVVLSSVGVYAVERFTAPLIEQIQFEKANAAKFTVFPALTTSDDLTPESGLSLSGTGIDEVIVLDGKGYIYTATFTGFQSQITYMIGVDLNGTITGYQTLQQGDTPGYGAQITNAEFSNQFDGKLLSEVGDGGFDGLSGASITTGGFMGSISKLADFHAVTFGGAVQLDPREEITSEGATFEDVTADYDVTGTPITKIELVNTDEAVIYTVTFEGYYEGNEYIIAYDLTTHDVTGFRVTDLQDTANIGGLIAEEDFMAQFVGLSSDDALAGDVDSVSGATAPETLSGLRETLESVTTFHLDQFAVPPTDAEIANDLIAETFTDADASLQEDVTASYPANDDILNIFNIYDEDSNLLGVVYYAEVAGEVDGSAQDVKLIVAINADGSLEDIKYVTENASATIVEINKIIDYHIANDTAYILPEVITVGGAN